MDGDIRYMMAKLMNRSDNFRGIFIFRIIGRIMMIGLFVLLVAGNCHAVYAGNGAETDSGEEEHIHVEVVDKMIRATTERDGKTAGSHCGTCGAILVKQQMIPRIRSIQLEYDSVVYDRTKKTPDVIVKDSRGNILKRMEDYTVSYDAGRVNAGIYQVHVNFRFRYKGTKDLEFTIRKRDISTTSITFHAGSFFYDKSAKCPEPKIVLENSEGRHKLEKGVSYTVSYSKNINPGKAVVVITGWRNYTGTTRRYFNIGPNATTITTIKNVRNGIALYWNRVYVADGYYIYRSVKSGEYKLIGSCSGSGAVRYIDETAIANGVRYNYIVVPYKISGNEYVPGQQSKPATMYRLLTQNTMDAECTTYGEISLNWVRNLAASGYIIEYSVDEDFTTAATIKVVDGKTETKVIRTLSPGKRYYFRIRSYMTENDMTYYAGWSSVRKVICK